MRNFILSVLAVLFIATFVCGGKVDLNSNRPAFLQSHNVDNSDRKQVREAKLKFAQRTPQFTKENNPFANSGYFNVNQTFGAHMYYVFFESKDGNKDAPVVLWLQGGPGCSSMTALFVENGPFHINENLQLEDNPQSWNNHFHVLYVDNPVGAGFSYVENKEGYVTNEEQVSTELYSMLLQFFGKYTQYAKNPFYVTGESYAGKYIPAIAHKIMTEGYKINLKGIAIGDGLTHPIEQFTAYDEFAYNTGLIDEKQREIIIQKQNASRALIEKEQWLPAMNIINDVINQVVVWGGNVNVYDIRAFGSYDFSIVSQYLSMPDVKQMMNTKVDWKECGSMSYQALAADMPKSIRSYVTDLLNNKVKVLLYNGQYDLIINVNGAQKWIRDMPWNGQQGYLNAPRKVWKNNGEIAGYVHQYDNLKQIIVVGAGHLLPMNQPANALDMLTRFINDKPF